MIPAPADQYSPQLRTALVLTGTGTDGAYHAGVLRALHEAGVKIDVVAGRGIGVVGALFAAIDGAQRLWDEKGFWRSPAIRSAYAWRRSLRYAGWAGALALAIVAVPVAVMALGLVVFPVDFVFKMAGSARAGGLVAWYVQAAQAAFAPDALPTWLPRLVVLVIGAALLSVSVNAWIADRGRRRRGAFWWHAVPAPLSATELVDHCWRVMWDLVRGAAQLRQPPANELARRYTEMLADNLGQPGFRELLLTAHDLDARRDLVFVLVAESRRRGMIHRPTTEAAEARRAEVFDVTGVAREYLADAVAAALTVPVAAGAHPLGFLPDAFWRGETHRLCDRPAALTRLLDELADLDVEQVLIVSAASPSPGPHALGAARADGRGRLGEYLRSTEASIVRDAVRLATGRIGRAFVIHPVHNPIGPLDFGGSYDDRSLRRQPLVELMNRGYEDAYHQFIEPVVGASGERVGRGGRQAAHARDRAREVGR